MESSKRFFGWLLATALIAVATAQAPTKPDAPKVVFRAMALLGSEATAYEKALGKAPVRRLPLTPDEMTKNPQILVFRPNESVEIWLKDFPSAINGTYLAPPVDQIDVHFPKGGVDWAQALKLFGLDPVKVKEVHAKGEWISSCFKGDQSPWLYGITGAWSLHYRTPAKLNYPVLTFQWVAGPNVGDPGTPTVLLAPPQ